MPATNSAGLDEMFSGSREMAQCMRAYDWAASALGPLDQWPENLRAAIRLCLRSRVPTCVWWGAARSFLYNDAFLPCLREAMHPQALILPGCDAWAEVWGVIAPMLDSVIASGEGTHSEDIPFIVTRNLRREEVHITWTCWPILSADGRTVDGIFGLCYETTQRVVGIRRLDTLLRLQSRATEFRSVKEACEQVAATLVENRLDIPFAAIYLLNATGQEARLVAAAPSLQEHLLSASVSVADTAQRTPWPLEATLRTRRTTACTQLTERGIRIRSSDGIEYIDTALLMPIQTDQCVGLLVAGVSARRPLDAEYKGFYELVTAQISHAIANASAHEAKRLSAEASAARVRDELAADLDALMQLQKLSARLLTERSLQPLVEEILEASITLSRADFGAVMLCEVQASAPLFAQRGFQGELVEHLYPMLEDTAVCAAALAPRGHVFVEDVLTDPSFLPHRKLVSAAGFRGAQSIALFGRGGEIIGVISTYFSEPHRPAARDVRSMDLYASQAVEAIERKRAQETLRASDERFQRCFELGLIGMALTSPTKGILSVNDELCRILGYEREELLQKTWHELTHPDDLDADVAQFERVLAAEIDGYTADKRFLGKDGRIVHSVMAARCVRRTDGSADYFIGLVQDITERKLAQEALGEARAELARVMRVTTMGELAASIAHEVNQPLAAIAANANAARRWLAGKPADFPEAEASLNRIADDANRAANIVNRIHKLLRRQPPRRDLVVICEVIDDVLALLHGTLCTTGVSVIFEPPDLVASVIGDRVSLQQVVMNLIMNAVEAMRTVQDRPRIMSIAVSEAPENMSCVSVRDAGIGLHASQLERIFDAFHTTKEDGMGMGLAISRSIVVAHGGRLWVTLNEGPGLTFRFLLPLAPRART